ncbi:MAG: hypothetical protein JKZ03_01400 [Flavobacteriaceae bacterium]|nr:hypothetical protein [Flavobacteriaceae bacterium]
MPGTFNKALLINKKYIKKEILKGFVIGLLSSGIGLIMCVFAIASIKNLDFSQVFTLYFEAGNLWMLMSLGALPNLGVFFLFIKQNNDYRARGVVMITMLIAISSYLIYFF